MQGFTDPDYASIYVTSIDCELKVCLLVYIIVFQPEIV